MKMICGTDFSLRAAHAANVAAKLARRLGDSIVMVHAVDLTTYSLIPKMSGVVTTFQNTIELELHDALHALTEKIERPGLQVECKVAFAEAAQALSHEADAQKARMLVVGTDGLNGVQRWLLGSAAEKLLQCAHAPVLVVGPDSKRLEAWAAAAETRHLHALVAIDHCPRNWPMVRWLATFRERFPMDVTFMHFYEPFAARERFHMWHDDTVALECVIKAHLKKDYGELPGEGTVTWEVHPITDTLGRSLQTEERASNADIVIMGTHQRPFLDRLMHASTSRQAVRLLSLPLLCIPDAAP